MGHLDKDRYREDRCDREYMRDVYVNVDKRAAGYLMGFAEGLPDEGEYLLAAPEGCWGVEDR